VGLLQAMGHALTPTPGVPTRSGRLCLHTWKTPSTWTLEQQRRNVEAAACTASRAQRSSMKLLKLLHISAWHTRRQEQQSENAGAAENAHSRARRGAGRIFNLAQVTLGR